MCAYLQSYTSTSELLRKNVVDEKLNITSVQTFKLMNLQMYKDYITGIVERK